jgi:hypothetical protein
VQLAEENVAAAGPAMQRLAEVDRRSLVTRPESTMTDIGDLDAAMEALASIEEQPETDAAVQHEPGTIDFTFDLAANFHGLPISAPPPPYSGVPHIAIGVADADAETDVDALPSPPPRPLHTRAGPAPPPLATAPTPPLAAPQGPSPAVSEEDIAGAIVAEPLQEDETTFERVRTLRRQQRQQLAGGPGDIVELQMSEITKIRREEGKLRSTIEHKYETEVVKMKAAQAKECESLLRKQAAERDMLLQGQLEAMEANDRDAKATQKRFAKEWKVKVKADLAAETVRAKKEQKAILAAAKASPTDYIPADVSMDVSGSALKRAALKHAKAQQCEAADAAREELEHSLEQAQARAEIELRQQLLETRQALEDAHLQAVS